MINDAKRMICVAFMYSGAFQFSHVVWSFFKRSNQALYDGALDYPDTPPPGSLGHFYIGINSDGKCLNHHHHHMRWASWCFQVKIMRTPFDKRFPSIALRMFCVFYMRHTRQKRTPKWSIFSHNRITRLFCFLIFGLWSHRKDSVKKFSKFVPS